VTPLKTTDLVNGHHRHYRNPRIKDGEMESRERFKTGEPKNKKIKKSQ